jgi:hypothetical protein
MSAEMLAKLLHRADTVARLPYLEVPSIRQIALCSPEILAALLRIATAARSIDRSPEMHHTAADNHMYFALRQLDAALDAYEYDVQPPTQGEKT